VEGGGACAPWELRHYHHSMPSGNMLYTTYIIQLTTALAQAAVATSYEKEKTPEKIRGFLSRLPGSASRCRLGNYSHSIIGETSNALNPKAISSCAFFATIKNTISNKISYPSAFHPAYFSRLVLCGASPQRPTTSSLRTAPLSPAAGRHCSSPP
jgi:hypothetical protein